MVSRHHKTPAVQKLIWGTEKSVDTERLNDQFILNNGINFDIILTSGHPLTTK